jgi:hypothetical protein
MPGIYQVNTMKILSRSSDAMIACSETVESTCYGSSDRRPGPDQMQAVNGSVDVELTGMSTRAPLEPNPKAIKAED